MPVFLCCHFRFCGAVYGFGRSSLFSARSDIYETDVPVQMVFADNRDRKAGFVSGNREWPIFWDGKAVFARNMRLSSSEKCFWTDFRDICPRMRQKQTFFGTGRASEDARIFVFSARVFYELVDRAVCGAQG